MKLQKQFVGVLFVLFLSCQVTHAQTCYDPYDGYYDCSQSYCYYYPDQGQAFIEGAFFGAILGGFAGQNNWRYGPRYYHGGGHYQSDGGYHGGYNGHQNGARPNGTTMPPHEGLGGNYNARGSNGNRR